MSPLDAIKMEIRENDCPMFSDDELTYYLSKNLGDIKAACYELLVLKSQNSTLQVSGYSSTDTSGYFLRLAQKFRTFHSGVASAQ